MLAETIYWCLLVSSTNILVQYKENKNVCSTMPIQLNIAYSSAGVSGKGNRIIPRW
jgi:hypothetical protein